MRGKNFIVMALILMSASLSTAGDFQKVHFAILGDRTGDHIPGKFGETLAEILRLKPDFILTVGDMIEGYTDDTVRLIAEWEEYKKIIEPSNIPIFHTPGNHDILSDVQDAMYRRYWGDPYYSFDRSGIHFIIVQNTRWENSTELPAEEMDWLKNDLEQNQQAPYTIVFMHKPFWYETTAVGKSDTLHTLFKNYGVDAVFTGHYHDYFVGQYDGIVYTGVGSSGGRVSPGPTGMEMHFMWVTADEEGLHINPIRKGSVLPWDEVTADDLRDVTKMGMTAVDMGKVFIATDLQAPLQSFDITINNPSATEKIKGSFKWHLPEGWNIDPLDAPLDIDPGDKATLTFKASSTGPLYPLPEAEFPFTYRDGKTTDIGTEMLIAREVMADRAYNKLKTNGKLKEIFWKRCETKMFGSDGEMAEIDSVEFYFAYDFDNLYLAARCFDAKMDSLRAEVKDHDGPIYGEDCVGYFIQPDINKEEAYQIYVNPLGTIFDQKLGMDEYGFTTSDRSWDGHYRVDVRRDKNFWTMEMAIPLDQFGVTAQSGDEWGLNFRRKQARLGLSGEWQTPIDYDPKSFGIMIME